MNHWIARSNARKTVHHFAVTRTSTGTSVLIDGVEAGTHLHGLTINLTADTATITLNTEVGDVTTTIQDLKIELTATEK